MATASADIVVNIATKFDDRAGRAAQQSIGKVGSAAKRALIPAVAVTGALVAFGASAVASASKLQQAMGGVDAVFGRNARTVKRWADQAADSIGLAKSEYGELATLIGSQLKNAQLPLDQVTQKTGDLVKMGADLAAMYGGTTTDAVAALSSALKGEFDPLEKYGASLSASAISADMAAKGADKLTGKAAKQAKVLSTLALIQEQTADAHGAAAREQDSLASRTQAASAAFENLKAQLGGPLLGALASVMNGLATVATWLSKNEVVAYVLIGVLAALAAAIIVVNVAMWALAANPIVLIIAGIVAVVVALAVALVLVWKKTTILQTAFKYLAAAGRAIGVAMSAAFAAIVRAVNVAHAAILRAFAAIQSAAASVVAWLGSKFTAVWRTVSAAAVRAFAPIQAAIDAIGSAISRVIGAIQSLIGWLSRIKVPKISIPGLGSLMSAPAPAASLAYAATYGAPVVASSAPHLTTTGGGGGVTINITGAVDPESTARQIRRLLNGSDIRHGVRTGLRTS